MKALLLVWICSLAVVFGQLSGADFCKLPDSDTTNIPKLGGFKSVTIKSIEPDGLKIFHEAGPAKIPIENLTDEQRVKYGLTMEGAIQYRKQLAENAKKRQARQQTAVTVQSADPFRKTTTNNKDVHYVTPEQVKIIWIQKIPQPRSLDPDYHKIIKDYQKFIAEIKAGKRDLDAQETAAIYNKGKAMEAGNMALASNYEAELSRVSSAKSAAAALEQQEKQARRDNAESMRYESQLGELNRHLQDIHNTISGW